MRFRTIPFFVSFLLSLSVMACLTCVCFTLTLWRQRRLKFNIFYQGIVLLDIQRDVMNAVATTLYEILST